VNAANTFLIPGGGVDGAIHRDTGPSLYDELKQYGSLAIRDALLNLKIKKEPLPSIRYYELITEKAEGHEYPPLPNHLLVSINKCKNKYCEDSDEFDVLAEDIVFIGNKWIRMYINW
jgi:hypothetical protein